MWLTSSQDPAEGRDLVLLGQRVLRLFREEILSKKINGGGIDQKTG
jgi:hypothetical protein